MKKLQRLFMRGRPFGGFGCLFELALFLIAIGSFLPAVARLRHHQELGAFGIVSLVLGILSFCLLVWSILKMPRHL